MSLTEYTQPNEEYRSHLIIDGHLGGTTGEGDPDSYFPELWDWLIDNYQVKSMLDVGCGSGRMQKYFRDFYPQIETLGLEGCQQVINYHYVRDKVIKHDFLDERYYRSGKYDLVWCCEVAEHIDAYYAHHLIETLVHNCGKVLGFCSAPDGCGGYHHVNCHNPDYWIKIIEKEGLVYDQYITTHAKDLCKEKANLKGWADHHRGINNYFCRSGLIFTKPE